MDIGFGLVRFSHGGRQIKGYADIEMVGGALTVLDLEAGDAVAYSLSEIIDFQVYRDGMFVPAGRIVDIFYPHEGGIELMEPVVRF